MHVVSYTSDTYYIMKTFVKKIKSNSVNIFSKTSGTFSLSFPISLMQQDNEIKEYENSVYKMILTEFCVTNNCLEIYKKGG